MRSYKAIFLDLDNTLFSFDDMYKKVAYHAIKYTIGLDASGVEFPAFYTQFRKNADRLYFEYEMGKQTMDTYRRLRWVQTFRDFNMTVSDKKLAELNHYILANYLNYVEPFPGSKLFLSAIRNSYKVGLITNGPVEMQTAKLEKLGFTAYFDPNSLIFSEAVGVSKPDPVIFNHALQSAGILPREALHIGDSLKHDILGANLVGIDSGLIHTKQLNNEEGTPTYHFTDFNDTLRILTN